MLTAYIQIATAQIERKTDGIFIYKKINDNGYALLVWLMFALFFIFFPS